MNLAESVACYVAASRQARYWDGIGECTLAARLRLASKKYMRKARWLKSVKNMMGDAGRRQADDHRA